MLQFVWIPAQMFSKAAQYRLIHVSTNDFTCIHFASPVALIQVLGVVPVSCRHYSHGQQSLIRRLKRFTNGMQQKGWSSTTSGSDGSVVGKESKQVPTKSGDSLGTSERKFLFISKDVMRKIKTSQTEKYYKFTDNNMMDVHDAKKEYLLDDKDLERLIKIKRSSPYGSHYPRHDSDTKAFIECVWTKDVEKVAIEKWGSMEILQKQKIKRQYNYGEQRFTPYKNLRMELKEAFGKDSGAVVMWALLMNTCNAVVKGIVWILSGSPSMFSEFLHSLGDCINQCFLATGRFLSRRSPDASHPYGYRNHVHIWSILSGVMIFSLGCGVTMYNGVLNLWHPNVMDVTTLTQVACVLFGTLLTESASLGFAVKEIRKKAKAAGQPFLQYVKDGDDPLCNVVLLEDLAGVIGVLICSAAITGSHLLGMPRLDAVGSLVISGMLAAVSGFLFKTNADILLGKALPNEREIKKFMEGDRFINAVLDYKTLDFGDESRVKCEVVLDATQVTRHYLNTEVDTDAMLVKWKSVKTTEDMEQFLEEFGVQICNEIVTHVDRTEDGVKKKFPEVRHIDIELS